MTNKFTQDIIEQSFAKQRCAARKNRHPNLLTYSQNDLKIQIFKNRAIAGRGGNTKTVSVIIYSVPEGQNVMAVFLFYDVLYDISD